MADPPDSCSVAVVTSDFIQILIPQNASTGYVWRVAECGDGLEVVGEEDRAQAIVPGAAGQHEVRLHAAAPGVWTVRLACQRPWEEVPIDERRLTVVVRTLQDTSSDPEDVRRVGPGTPGSPGTPGKSGVRPS